MLRRQWRCCALAFVLFLFLAPIGSPSSAKQFAA